MIALKLRVKCLNIEKERKIEGMMTPSQYFCFILLFTIFLTFLDAGEDKSVQSIGLWTLWYMNWVFLKHES
jgi:hypothetical protein